MSDLEKQLQMKISDWLEACKEIDELITKSKAAEVEMAELRQDYYEVVSQRNTFHTLLKRTEAEISEKESNWEYQFKSYRISHRELHAQMAVMRKGLEDIELCLGFAPDHCGESYEFVLDVVNQLQARAKEALSGDGGKRALKVIKAAKEVSKKYCTPSGGCLVHEVCVALKEWES